MATAKMKEYSTILSFHVLVTVTAASEDEADDKFRAVWDDLIAEKEGYLTVMQREQAVVHQMNHKEAFQELDEDERWEDRCRPIW